MQLDAPEDNDEYAFINLETQSESQTPRQNELITRRNPKINNFSLNNEQPKHHKVHSFKETDQLHEPALQEHRGFAESLKQTVKVSRKGTMSKTSSGASSVKQQSSSGRDSDDYEAIPKYKVTLNAQQNEDERGEEENLATVATERGHFLGNRETEEIEVEEEKSYQNLETLQTGSAQFDKPLRMDLELVHESISEFSPNDKTSTRSILPMTPSTARWKNIKSTVNVVSFHKRAEQAMDRKTAAIMRGKTFHEMSARSGITCVIYPNSTFKITWDLLVSITLIYFAFVTPIRWSQRINNSDWRVQDIIMDIFTLMDIVLFFFTAIIEPNLTITSKKLIAKRYLKTFLIFDVAAALPLYLIDVNLYMFKILRMLHLPRAYRVISDRILNYPRLKMLLKFLRALFIFWFVLGLLTALWVYPGEYKPGDDTWIQAEKIDSNDSPTEVFNLYLLGAYFLVTTISTVGFGDIAPENSREDFLVMVYQFIGIVLTGFLQAQLFYFLESDLDTQARKKETDLEAWLLRQECSRLTFTNEAGLSSFSRGATHLLKDIHSYFQFYTSHDYKSLIQSIEFFGELPPQRQEQVTLLVFTPLFTKFRAFFRFFENLSFQKEIVISLDLKIFEPETVLIPQSNQSKGLYFILKGFVMLSHQNTALLMLNEGSFFGESTIFSRDCLLQHSIGDEPLHCFYLSQKDLAKICERYPEEKKIFRRMINERNRYYKNIIKKLSENAEIMKETSRKEIESPRKTPKSKKSLQYRKKKFSFLPKTKREPSFKKTKIVPTLVDCKTPENVDTATLPKIDNPSKRSSDDQGSEQILKHSDTLNLHKNNKETAAHEEDLQTPVTNIDSRTILGSFSQQQLVLTPQISEGCSLIKTTSVAKASESLTLIMASTRVLAKGKSKKSLRKLDNSNKSLRFINGKLQKKQQTRKIAEINSTINEDDRSESDNENHNFHNGQQRFDEDLILEDENENGSELDNSLEIPLGTVEPSFKSFNECGDILEYIDEKVSDIDFHLQKLTHKFREDIMQDWKKLKEVSRREFTDKKNHQDF